ncbi:hypothetical protein ACFE04_024804 [Oxalis oulophora]
MESPSSGSSKRARASKNGSQVPSCLVDGCNFDLGKCREYHRRHKVCELHSKTSIVTIKGQEQRFCQQCSRFHSLGEFDEGKRSCRKRLDGHNRRRRKPQIDSINPARFLSNHQGTDYVPFTGPQIFSASSDWTATVEPEKKVIFFGNQSEVSINNGKNLLSNYKVGKQFPFLQTSSASQQVQDSNSSSTNNGHKMFSDGSSNCALSLLSSPLSETREIGLSHVVQPPDRIPTSSSQSLISSLMYTSCLGMDGGEQMQSIGVSSGSSSNLHAHGQEMYQIAPDESPVNVPQQTLSFWE